MTAEDVWEIILGPMQDLYMPGQHIRNNREAQQRALNEMVRSLEKFDRITLERAWEQVKAGHDLVIWPPVGVIETAARFFEPKPAPPSEQAKRLKQALEMTDNKVSGYMKTSKLSAQAKREGWSGHLRAFVHGLISIQAQIHCGCQGIGYTSRLLAGTKHYQTGKLKEILNWMGDSLLKEKKLRVKPPPKELILRWKTQAQEESTERGGPLEATLQRLMENYESASSNEQRKRNR